MIMKKTIYIQLIICLISFGLFQTTNNAQDHSLGQARTESDRPIKRIGKMVNGEDLGYGSNAIGGAWYSVGVPSGALMLLGSLTSFHQGGDFDATGTFYATLSPSTLITVDVATGVESIVTPITGVTAGQTITSMAWCDALGTMYIGSTDTTTSELYTLDLITGVATLVGGSTIGQAGLSALACDCDGNLYSADLVTDDIWSIDPSTGIGTVIGPTGFDLNFAQDADFNTTDTTMYLAAYNNTTGSGQLRSVDLATGSTTLLLDWGSVQLTDFGIEGNCVSSCPVGQSSNPDPANGVIDVDVNVGSLNWTNGSGVTSIDVWFDGVMVYSGTPVSTYVLPILDFSTTYSWRVDGSDSSCTTFGLNWSFTTINDTGKILVFLDEFESGLGNWIITNDGGTCDWLQYCQPFPNTYTISGSTGCLMGADSDDCGASIVATATMAVPVDLSLFQSVWIEFDNDWNIADINDEAHLEVSTDGGGVWTSVFSWIGVPVRNTHEIWDVSSIAGRDSSVLFRFKSVQPGHDWWWVIDNFNIYASDLVPVELTSFAATVNENDVNLSWSTATETNNMGFEIQRSSNGEDYNRITFVEGNGTVAETQDYTFLDKNLEVGSYTYRLKQIDFDGTSEYSDIVEVEILAPDIFKLEQNYPNPFNPSTNIKFSLPEDSKVTLTVFDILGQEVITLINGNLSAGAHNIDFNASSASGGLNSGVYFYRIDATNFTSVKKMILTK
jgi:hypothetical protein